MLKTNKKILIIYPHNFFERNNGINNMFYFLTRCLKSMGFSIDLFTLKNYESKWDAGYPFDKKLIDNLFFYDFATKPKPSLKRALTKIFIKPSDIVQHLPDNTTPMMRDLLVEILSKNKYSHLIVGYAYWANLIKDLDTGNTQKIISINDWLTVQMKNYYHDQVNVTNFLKDEIDRINMFDTAIEISTFEHHLFSQLAPHPKHYLVPIFFEATKITKNAHPKYDITFLAHKNIYNIEGIKWFLKEVLPLIPKTKLLIVGKVNCEIGKVNNKYVTQIEQLDVSEIKNIYKDTKAVICPLFGGTGLKVKIIEALSYGTPVVCTAESMVGFPYESDNGILIENDPKDFARQIAKLISNKSFLSSQSSNAKKYFDKYFSVASTGKKLKEIFK